MPIYSTCPVHERQTGTVINHVSWRNQSISKGEIGGSTDKFQCNTQCFNINLQSFKANGRNDDWRQRDTAAMTVLIKQMYHPDGRDVKSPPIVASWLRSWLLQRRPLANTVYRRRCDRQTTDKLTWLSFEATFPVCGAEAQLTVFRYCSNLSEMFIEDHDTVAGCPFRYLN